MAEVEKNRLHQSQECLNPAEDFRPKHQNTDVCAPRGPSTPLTTCKHSSSFTTNEFKLFLINKPRPEIRRVLCSAANETFWATNGAIPIILKSHICALNQLQGILALPSPTFERHPSISGSRASEMTIPRSLIMMVTIPHPSLERMNLEA